MTAKQKYNYSGSGRRVRPTTIKLSNTKQKLLEALHSNKGLFIKRGTDLNYSLWEDGKYGLRLVASRIDRRTVNSLIKSGLLAQREELYMEPGRPKFDISDTGRAALAANGGQS